MPKKGTHKFCIVYSAFYGDEPKPVHWDNDKAVLEKWLKEHRAQYASGLAQIVAGDAYPHEIAPEPEPEDEVVPA